MTVVLALGAALMYGLSDFAGGLLSRRGSVWPVAVVAQISATVIMVGATVLLPAGRPAGVDWMWGAVAGIGSGAGTVFLYRGLASGCMGVVAPISAVGAALVPIVAGLVSGERPPPLTWIGIVCAFPAIWLVSTSPGDRNPEATLGPLGPGTIDGLLAGLGFGLMFATLGQVSDTAGLGPLALVQATSVAAVIGLAAVLRQTWMPRDRSSWRAAIVGALAAAAAILFLLSSQTGLLAVASVITSLYPAFTVLLAVLVLRERIHGPQAIGLLLAALAVGLVAAG